MSRTTIELDDRLVNEAMARFGLPTASAAVDYALRRLLSVPVDAAFIRSLHGIGWDGDLEEQRAGDAVVEW